MMDQSLPAFSSKKPPKLGEPIWRRGPGEAEDPQWYDTVQKIYPDQWHLGCDVSRDTALMT